MRPFQLLILLIILTAIPSLADAASKMRPYTGIGVLKLPSTADPDPFYLYNEPGISRCCNVEPANLKSLNNWLFEEEEGSFLLVVDRKGEWLEVEHDDAGRTGWLIPERRWIYKPWSQFLKGRQVRFLNISPKKFMRVVSAPGGIAQGRQLSSKEPMKVIMAQEDWLYVMLNQNSAGWVRWRDTDGRLLVGFTSH